MHTPCSARSIRSFFADRGRTTPHSRPLPAAMPSDRILLERRRSSEGLQVVVDPFRNPPEVVPVHAGIQVVPTHVEKQVAFDHHYYEPEYASKPAPKRRVSQGWRICIVIGVLAVVVGGAVGGGLAVVLGKKRGPSETSTASSNPSSATTTPTSTTTDIFPGSATGSPTACHGTICKRMLAATTWNTGRAIVMGVSEQKGLIYKTANGASWDKEWTSLEATTYTPPAVISWGSDRLDVFCIGDKTGLFTKYSNAGPRPDSWSGWNRLGEEFAQPPAVASWGPERMDVFAINPSGRLIHRIHDNVNGGQTWAISDPTDFGGSFVGAPAAISRNKKQIDLFVINQKTGTMLYRIWQDTNWSTAWEDLGGSFQGSPYAASWGANRVDVVALGKDSALWHRAWTGASFTPWLSLGGRFQSDPAIVATDSNRVDIIALAADNILWHKSLVGEAWSKWEKLGVNFSGAPVAVSREAKGADVFIYGLNRRLMHRSLVGDRWADDAGDWDDFDETRSFLGDSY